MNRILYPTDFSEQADAALAMAVDLALRHEAQLHALHIADDRGGAYAAARSLSLHEEEDLTVRLRERINAYVSRLPAEQREQLKLVYEMAEGRPAWEVICTHARRHNAGLIVMGTHGRRGLRHLLLGSVAEGVIRAAPSPVLTVRRPPALPVEHVLVPVDFSDLSRVSLAQAGWLAARFEARITLLFVAEEHVVPFFSDTGIPTFTLKKIDKEIISHAGEALRELAASTDGLEVSIQYVVEDGLPVEEIVDYAEEQEVDLIVMATHGLSGFDRRLLGSVTERVVRAAPCPVWTLNPVAAGLSSEATSSHLGEAQDG